MRHLFAYAYLGGILWLLSWEIAALVINVNYTLSRIWWQIEGNGWTAARYGALVILVFLTVHLAFGWFRLCLS